jgi:hypothetical protein
MTALNLDTNCAHGTFNLPYPAEDGLSVVVALVALPGSMKLAEVAGRWSAATAGWTIGEGWWCAMTGTPNPTLPS